MKQIEGELIFFVRELQVIRSEPNFFLLPSKIFRNFGKFLIGAILRVFSILNLSQSFSVVLYSFS